MKKFSLLILIFGVLFLFSCQRDGISKDDIFIARAVLVGAKYGVEEGFGSTHWWELRFDNNMVVVIVDNSSFLDYMHFVEGAEYDIYRARSWSSNYKVRKVE